MGSPLAERYLADGKNGKFSTGNHPVEMLPLMYHLDLAGSEIAIATPSGDPVKLRCGAFTKTQRSRPPMRLPQPTLSSRWLTKP